MHQLIVTDTNGTVHRTVPAELTDAELSQVDELLAELGGDDVRRLALDTASGTVTVVARHVVAAQLVKAPAIPEPDPSPAGPAGPEPDPETDDSGWL